MSFDFDIKYVKGEHFSTQSQNLASGYVVLCVFWMITSCTVCWFVSLNCTISCKTATFCLLSAYNSSAFSTSKQADKHFFLVHDNWSKSSLVSLTGCLADV